MSQRNIRVFIIYDVEFAESLSHLFDRRLTPEPLQRNVRWYANPLPRPLTVPEDPLNFSLGAGAAPRWRGACAQFLLHREGLGDRLTDAA